MAAILEVYGIITEVNALYTSARDRIEKASRNPRLAQNLADLFERLQTELFPLAKHCEDNDVNFSDQQLGVFKRRIDELSATMKNIKDELKEKINKLKKPWYGFVRARATSDWLSQIESTACGADQLVVAVTGVFANAAVTVQKAAEIKEGIEQVRRDVGASKRSADDEQEEFQPSFDQVPENPPHVVLRFGSKSDIGEGTAVSLTVEARLKRAVLQSDGARSVAAVGSMLGVTGVRGMSGVGKSCALRGIAKDVEVRGQFRDGIYFMVLGKDATEADVMRSISKIMMMSGSKRMAREAREGIDEAISKARVWFKGKCILLEIDDVWGENDSLLDIVGRLSSVVDMDVGSRVLFSTRDARMAAGSEVIHFGGRDDEASREILLSAAGLGGADVTGCGEIVGEVIGYCGGIPMALAVAGSAIKMLLPPIGSLSSADALREWAAGLQRCRQRLVRLKVVNDSYNTLEKAFRTSLNMLDGRQEQSLAFKCETSMLEMYRALAVMRRQGWIPVTVLRGLWNLTDEYEAIDVMQELVLASLAQREDRVVNGEKVPGITLHDLHLDFVQGEVSEHREVEMWHRKVLRIWLQEVEGSSSSKDMVGNRNWCKEEVFRDEYVRNNVCRHLMVGGLQDELCLLLKNPLWAVKRLCCDEILPLEEDFRTLVEYLERMEEPTEAGSVIWSLNMISAATRLSTPYVSRNGREVWFQLYGRLLHHAKRSDIVRNYIVDIERCAKGPWLKALIGCLVEPGGALQSTMLCEGNVYSIINMKEDDTFVVCGLSGDGCVFVSTFVSGQVEKTVWLPNGDTLVHIDDDVPRDDEEGLFVTGSALLSSRKSSDVRAMCCTRDGSRVAAGYTDGRIQIWEVKSGKALGEALLGHSGRVRCVAWSPVGGRIASGGDDGMVRLWDVEKGEAVGEALVGHGDFVRCVEWSDDGQRIASGGQDCTLRLWDAEKGEAVGDALVGHSERVQCVAWSPNRKQIVSGGLDGTVRLWDVERREAIGEALIGHSDFVRWLAWSPNGMRVASGADDRTVRLWNVEEGKAVGEALVGHGDYVRCLSWSAGGQQIASGGDDGTVRLWDVGKGEAIRETLMGHSSRVRCVAWSPKGRQIASGGHDEIVRVWDFKEGDVVEKALVGHSGWVLCVAWSPDGKQIASGGYDGTVRMWNVEKGEAVGEALVGHSDWVRCVAWSPDGKWIASGADDGTVLVWDVEKGRALGEALVGHSDWVQCVAWSPDNKWIASGGCDETVRVWDLKNGEAVTKVLVGHRHWVQCVQWSCDGKRIASGGWDETLRVWEIESGKCTWTEKGWVMGDLSRLNFLLGKQDMSSGDEAETKMTIVDGIDVVYSCEGKKTTLGTLEEEAFCWEYSKACQSVAVGGREGGVFGWRLLE